MTERCVFQSNLRTASFVCGVRLSSPHSVAFGAPGRVARVSARQQDNARGRGTKIPPQTSSKCHTGNGNVPTFISHHVHHSTNTVTAVVRQVECSFFVEAEGGDGNVGRDRWSLVR